MGTRKRERKRERKEKKENKKEKERDRERKGVMGRENNSVKKIEEEERASGIIARNEIRVSAER